MMLFLLQDVVNADTGVEQCYGVAKAGQNDCAASSPDCDKSVMDADPNYWINLPKGICTRLVGGSLTSGTAAVGSEAQSIQVAPASPSAGTVAPSAPAPTTLPATAPGTTAPATSTQPGDMPATTSTSSSSTATSSSGNATGVTNGSKP